MDKTTSFLQNRYWILRHGKSIPNEKGLIVSSLYQLAPDGVNQAQLAGELFLKELNQNNIAIENVRICYSPFSRTTHTAKVVASVLNLPFDGPQCKYPEIWALDEKDPFIPPEGGESVDDVASRLAVAMATMESEFQGCSILVVSHGDPLQILQTILNATKQVNGAVQVPTLLSQHRKFALETGELRRII